MNKSLCFSSSKRWVSIFSKHLRCHHLFLKANRRCREVILQSSTEKLQLFLQTIWLERGFPLIRRLTMEKDQDRSAVRVPGLQALLKIMFKVLQNQPKHLWKIGVVRVAKQQIFIFVRIAKVAAAKKLTSRNRSKPSLKLLSHKLLNLHQPS